MINVKNYSCKYNNDVILDDFNINIDDGEFLCIVGENGSGKSSLIKCILGVNPSANCSGEIERPKTIGYTPQKTEIQSNFPASVEEVVLSGTIVNNPKNIFYTKDDRKTMNEVLEKLNIVNLKNKCFRELSGGQQQRVLIARALCSSSDVIILDEPVNGLDPLIVDQIYHLLKELNDNGMTIIMITHDIIRIKDYCSRIVEISKGKIVYDGTSEKYSFGGAGVC